MDVGMDVELPGQEVITDVGGLLTQHGQIHFLNTTILPSGIDGLWRVATVDKSFVRHMLMTLAHDGLMGFIVSHVGHEATATVANEVLGLSPGEIPVNRTPWDGNGIAVAVQLNGRIQEGAILSREQMEEIGYTFRVLYRMEG